MPFWLVSILDTTYDRIRSAVWEPWSGASVFGVLISLPSLVRPHPAFRRLQYRFFMQPKWCGAGNEAIHSPQFTAVSYLIAVSSSILGSGGLGNLDISNMLKCTKLPRHFVAGSWE